jgi:hypothetical protein
MPEFKVGVVVIKLRHSVIQYFIKAHSDCSCLSFLWVWLVVCISISALSYSAARQIVQLVNNRLYDSHFISLWIQQHQGNCKQNESLHVTQLFIVLMIWYPQK